MENQILSGGLDQLREIKKSLMDLENYETQKKSLDSAEKKLAKDIKNKEKSIADEIAKTIKDRKDHIESTYDKPIDEAKSKVKKVQSKKVKTKKRAVSERINSETEQYRLEIKDIKAKKKMLFRKEGIPSIFNNRFFFAVYLPKGFGDIAIIFAKLLVLLFVIPCGVFFLWFAGKSYLILALFYIIIIVIFGGLYLLIGKIKYKHLETLRTIRDLRSKHSETKKKKKHLIKQIRHDKDESSYGLDKYNSENTELEKVIDKLSEEKRNALMAFDNEKRSNIINEIAKSHQEDLDHLKSDYEKTRNQNKVNSDNLVTVSTKIATEYEVYLDKSYMTVEKINQLENLLHANQASTIAEALDLLKKTAE